jgi:phenylalanyl-tRNA synthetase beta chain
MVRALGIAGKVHAGIFVVLPEKLAAGSRRGRFAEFSLFPPALRDIALVVDEAEPAAVVRGALVGIAGAAAAPGFALESAEVFDVYRGAGLPEGRKSLAFSLVFRAADRTLTDDEVNAALHKIQRELEKTGRYDIRK